MYKNTLLAAKGGCIFISSQSCPACPVS